MIEVEVRAKVKDFVKIKEKLNEFGAEFVESVNQEDIIFGNSIFVNSNKMVIEGGIISRIRSVDDKCFLEFKEICREGGGIELQSELGDINIGRIFLDKIGFEEVFTINKKRDSYRHKSYSVELDYVKGLGNFIEVEKIISSFEEIKSVREECINILKLLSPESKIENKKYGDLMQELINENGK